MIDQPRYSYSKRDELLTHAERRFFYKLESVLPDKYLLFPQMSLGAIFNSNEDMSYSWSAYRHISQKSVDFVICNHYLEPILAIELDDWSHLLPHRKKRDHEVERIFLEASLPLVRFWGKGAKSAGYIKAILSQYL